MAGKIQNQLAQTQQGNKPMQQYIKSMEGEIAKALPSVITPERFTRIVLSAISVNPKLAECTPKSFLGAMMTSAQLGLEVNTPLGQAYVIPYMNHGVMEAQFQLGYKGLTSDMYVTVSFVNHVGKTVTDTITSDEFGSQNGAYFIILDQVEVASARSLMTITVYNADGTVYDTHVDSVESYLARTTSGSALYPAIMKFAVAAYNYFQ
jgi:hypothetical protein